jgi:hypothetical protein
MNRCLLSVVFLGAVISSHALAQDTANLPTEEAADVKIQPEAIGALDRMAAHLRTLQSFTLIADTTQDDVLEGGERWRSPATTPTG